MPGWIVLAIVLAIGTFIVGRADGATIYGYDLADATVAFIGFIIAVSVVASLASGVRGGLLRAMRDLAVWSLLMIGVAAGYSYRDELLGLGHRVIGDIAPPGTLIRVEPQAEGERSVRIRRRPDGHFIAKTEINGVSLVMLVDTGASTVVLRPADAQRLGIDPDKLRYNVPVQTANGTTYAASVRLKQFAVGTIVFNDVEALVSKAGALRDSLLGMSFLNRLRSYEFSGEYLTFRI